jgi:hypothetical protein
MEIYDVLILKIPQFKTWNVLPVHTITNEFLKLFHIERACLSYFPLEKVTFIFKFKVCYMFVCLEKNLEMKKKSDLYYLEKLFE